MSESETPEEEVVTIPDSEYGVPLSFSRGQKVLHPTRDQYLELVKTLHQDGYNMCIDVTATDYLKASARELPSEVKEERFEVVTNLLSYEKKERVRIRVQLPSDDPSVSSIVDVYPGAEAMEREAFDLVGVYFVDHPDLTRILMPEDWEGHPLRKDYGQGTVPVQFSTPPQAR